MSTAMQEELTQCGLAPPAVSALIAGELRQKYLTPAVGKIAL